MANEPNQADQEEAKKIADKATKRNNIHNELIKTEETYVNLLSTVKKEDLGEYLNAAGKREVGMDLYKILEKFTEISEQQQKVLAAVKEYNPALWTAKIKELEKLYTDYNILYDQYFKPEKYAQYLKPATKDAPERLAIETLFKSKNGGKGLTGVLITPVQRTPRYELLFKDLQKATTDPVALEEITNALTTIHSMAVNIDNEIKLAKPSVFRLLAERMLGKKIVDQILGFFGKREKTDPKSSSVQAISTPTVVAPSTEQTKPVQTDKAKSVQTELTARFSAATEKLERNMEQKSTRPLPTIPSDKPEPPPIPGREWRRALPSTIPSREGLGGKDQKQEQKHEKKDRPTPPPRPR